jgi:hypothetical protein
MRSRLAGGFQRYGDSGATTGRKTGNMFLIGHELFLWSPRGFLTGSANTVGSILVGTHFERTDVYDCGALRSDQWRGIPSRPILIARMGYVLLRRPTYEYWRECFMVRCFQP